MDKYLHLINRKPRNVGRPLAASAAQINEVPWRHQTGESLRAQPYPDGAMAFWPVDRRVGNVRNDDPDLFTALSMGDRALSRGLAAPLRK